MDKVLLGKEDKDLEVVIMLADKTEIRKSTENMDMVILFQQEEKQAGFKKDWMLFIIKKSHLHWTLLEDQIKSEGSMDSENNQVNQVLSDIIICRMNNI